MLASTKVRICSVDSCNNKNYGKGYCKKHYGRWKRHGNPDVILKKGKPRKYCIVNDCGNQNYAYGYCSKHWQRLLKHNSLEKRVKVREKCKVKNCNNLNHGKGYCKSHWGKLIYTPSIAKDTEKRDKRRKSALNAYYNHKDVNLPKQSMQRRLNRIDAIKMIGVMCESCGEKFKPDSKPMNLEFHHKYYDEYDEKMIKKYGRNPSNWTQVLKMAKEGKNPKEKFSVLCRTCHMIETFIHQNQNKAWSALSWCVEQGILDVDTPDDISSRKITEFLK